MFFFFTTYDISWASSVVDAGTLIAPHPSFTSRARVWARAFLSRAALKRRYTRVHRLGRHAVVRLPYTHVDLAICLPVTGRVSRGQTSAVEFARKTREGNLTLRATRRYIGERRRRRRRGEETSYRVCSRSADVRCRESKLSR